MGPTASRDRGLQSSSYSATAGGVLRTVVVGPARAAAARLRPPAARRCHPDASRQAHRWPARADALAIFESARSELLVQLGRFDNAARPRVAPASWQRWSRPGRNSAGRGHRLDTRAPLQSTGDTAAIAPTLQLRRRRRRPCPDFQRSGSRLLSCVWTRRQKQSVLAAGRAREPGAASSAWLASRQRKEAGDCVKGSLRRAPPALDSAARFQVQNRHLTGE
jgi:hypothetical protein